MLYAAYQDILDGRYRSGPIITIIADADAIIFSLY